MTSIAAAEETVRHRIRVVGVVQGVGFRPFVHRLANELVLAGHVGNDTEGVFIEVEGPTLAADCFARRLVADAPPLAKIFSLTSSDVATSGERSFRIVESVVGANVRTFVSPDIATCEDCRRELLDPHDRRFRYPFINCTNCGPRFTITRQLPYDRANTTMADFSMCEACAREYHDPEDRRFHAQPIACDDCGPRIRFHGADGVTWGTDDAVGAAQAAFARGEVVAVKGLGGYHLACDATNSDAVARLRRRKHRPDKPLAVMVPDVETARELTQLNASETTLLSSAARPIVLIECAGGSWLSEFVAPGSPYLGIFLPYTPLHELLFGPVPGSSTTAPRALVMTSGNLSDEPICYDDDDARQRLGTLVDAWLIHDRPIHVPCDDSVMRSDGNDELPIRRSRGYAPLPVQLPFVSVPLLAVGGELKNTFCLASENQAWMSQHLGDMGSVETLHAFERSIVQFSNIYRVEPTLVASDAHPGYLTRRWAEQHTSVSPELVQHHHAHLAAVMAEHGVHAGDRVIGFAFDGTGYGTDGAIWGGEVLITGYGGFDRATHLSYVPLPGGDATIRKPFRAALAHLWAAGVDWQDDLAPVRHATASERRVLARQLERNFQCVATSSMGRLFDAVSSLIGVRHVVSYEAQAAIELECLARDVDDAAGYEFDVRAGEFSATPVLRAIVDDLRHGCSPGAIAARFHQSVAALVADVAESMAGFYGLECVALSGGVFQNLLLVRLTRARLQERGLRVLTHRVVPPNDGGLALGQVAVANFTRAKEVSDDRVVN